jgi:monoamine oxidase
MPLFYAQLHRRYGRTGEPISRRDAARLTDPFEPWLTDGAEKWDRRTLADWIESLETSALCKSAVDAMMTSDNGVRCAWQSYLGNLAMVKGGGLQGYWTDTERFRCKGGNQLLAMRLAAALGSSRIRLRTTVQAVDVANETATVRLADGSRLDADDVVLAVPPPVWNRIAIDPPLPPTLVTQMGSNVKFLIALRSRFWQREGLAPDLLSDGLIQQTWHQTDNQAGAGWSMVAFSGGPSADFCREWPAAERNARYLAELGRVYRDLRRNFVRARFMDWPGDAWSKGSYSFPAPGQVTTIGPTLRAGLGRLHFAGEHTCYAFTGYMEGALRSGVDVAQRIASRDGLLKNVA